MPTYRWVGNLGYANIPTTEETRRQLLLAPGDPLRHATLPLPLTILQRLPQVRGDATAHYPPEDTAEVVGTITALRAEPYSGRLVRIAAAGLITIDHDAPWADRLLRAGVEPVAMSVDDVETATDEGGVHLFTRWRITGASLPLTGRPVAWDNTFIRLAGVPGELQRSDGQTTARFSWRCPTCGEIFHSNVPAEEHALEMLAGPMTRHSGPYHPAHLTEIQWPPSAQP